MFPASSPWQHRHWRVSSLPVQILAKTLQATTATETNWTYDQSWLAIMCTSPSIQKRHVAIARLKNPCNFGRNCQEARFIVFILSPMKEKGTKNFLETGRTFATIFADIELRAKLLKAATQQEFISIIDVSLCFGGFSRDRMMNISSFHRNIPIIWWNNKQRWHGILCQIHSMMVSSIQTYVINAEHAPDETDLCLIL